MATLTVYRGDDVTLNGTVRDQDSVAVNIAGWSFLLSAAVQKGSTPVFQVAGVIDVAASGTFHFTLSRSTHTNAVQSLVYDVQATTSDNKVHTLETGTLTIQQDVTP